MVVGITVCHKDINQFWRWLRWTARMRELPYSHELYIMGSKGIQPEIEEIWKEAIPHWESVHFKRCESEDERGWPASPTHLFINLLEWVEADSGDDLLFCEPDTTPLSSDWIETLQSEFEEGRRPFMGVAVKTMPDGVFMGFADHHMSGVGIYGKDWREEAPALAEVLTASCDGALFPTGHAWDLFAGHQTVPNMTETKQIQHTWRPHFTHKESLGIVAPETTLFHQTKDGDLMRLWDAVNLGGRILNGELDLLDKPVVIPPSFYYTNNFSKPFRVQKGVYMDWKRVGMPVAGVAGGVMEVHDPARAILLDFESTHQHGIQKLTAAEYEGLTHKIERFSLLSR